MLKRTMVVFATLLCVASLPLVALGQKESAKTAGTLTIVTPDNTYGWSTDPELQGAITQMIEKKTGVSVTPIIPPLASYTDKLSTLINSGDIPDIFAVNQAMNRIPQMVAREQILDLTDYIKKSPQLSKMDPSLFSSLLVEGKIYFIPYNLPKAKVLYLRKDLMDQYGVKLSHTPTTEEFRTEMKKLVGKGVIPFCFPKWVDNFQFFYNSFAAWGGIYKKDAKYVDGFQSSEMKDALTYLAQLYKDGILNQEFLTTENNAMREQTYTGRAASDIDYVSNYINYVQNTAAANKPTEMFLIYKIVGPTGKGGALNEAIQTAFSISSKTKNPEGAVKVIETIITDKELYQAFFGVGLENFHYTLDANKLIVPTSKAATSGYNYTFNFLSDSITPFDVDALSFGLDAKLKAGINAQAIETRAVQSHLAPNYTADVPVGKSASYDRVAPSIKSTRESIAAKVIVGNVSIEQGLAEYANFWKSIDGAKILAELNAIK